MRYDAPPDWLDRELVLAFFWRFSAFECALKREGFLTADKFGGAQPDWKAFGITIRGRFAGVRANGFQIALETLLKAQPRRQVAREGRLGWEIIERRESESEEEFVLRLVKAARNNLFHGGKYPDGPIEGVARDKAILRAALGVLEGCYELHPGIARWRKEAA